MSQPAHVAIVMPCFNEEAVLLRSCSSLGFGPEALTSRADNTTLILVDNASEDRTLSVIEAIRDSSPTGSVLIAHENTRGYVPPRHRGTVVAAELCRYLGISSTDLLLLQADADTSYKLGYVEAMVAASTAGSNILLEGLSEPDKLFTESWPDYIKFVDAVDRRIFANLPPAPLDIIADDKVCGYRLSDYLQWGGHKREFAANGDEIHAESSRLLIRALSVGARKITVPFAVAETSCRRITENAALFFSTAGFPHGKSWREAWHKRNADELQSVNALLEAASDQVTSRYAVDRFFHSLILFSILPRQVATALDHPMSNAEVLDILSEQISRDLTFSRFELDMSPGRVFERGFAFMAENEHSLQVLAAKLTDGSFPNRSC